MNTTLEKKSAVEPKGTAPSTSIAYRIIRLAFIVERGLDDSEIAIQGESLYFNALYNLSEASKYLLRGAPLYAAASEATERALAAVRSNFYDPDIPFRHEEPAWPGQHAARLSREERRLLEACATKQSVLSLVQEPPPLDRVPLGLHVVIINK